MAAAPAKDLLVSLSSGFPFNLSSKAIETGVADLADPGLKERIAGLQAIRDQAQADTMRAQAVLDSAAQQPITTTVLRKFASTARKRMRIEGGGYRRDHLRALAQRVEVADHEVRIMGSKSDLLRTLAAISGVKSATGGVRSSVLNWRTSQSTANRSLKRDSLLSWKITGNFTKIGLFGKKPPVRTSQNQFVRG